MGIAGLAVGLLALFLISSGFGEGHPTASATKTPAGRSPRADQVEAAIVETDLAGKLEEALGDEFGGAWFDPSAARLDVGVTSAASRAKAERIAAEAKLSPDLAPTPVNSTWAELEAAQARWNQRLTGLFERSETSTSLDPEHNSVKVELGSGVEPSERAALRRYANAGNVPVSIETAPSPKLKVARQARCNGFIKGGGGANCDPTLVAGTTFRNSGRTETCTTGPTVLKKEPKERTKTYVLTAGHCIDGGGGDGIKWYAASRADALKEKEHEVGESIFYLDTSNSHADVGVVEVNTFFWARPGSAVPVEPTIAPLFEGFAEEPFVVTGQSEPVVNMRACVSGQTTGTQCGKIVALHKTLGEKVPFITEELVEVEGVKTAAGDSGAPWYDEEEFGKLPPRGQILGTHVGENQTTHLPLFEPIRFDLEKLESDVGIHLELLTIANANREGGCPVGEPVGTIRGAGSTLQGGAQEVWGQAFHELCPGLTMEYERIGSGPGLEEWGFIE